MFWDKSTFSFCQSHYFYLTAIPKYLVFVFLLKIILTITQNCRLAVKWLNPGPVWVCDKSAQLSQGCNVGGCWCCRTQRDDWCSAASYYPGLMLHDAHCSARKGPRRIFMEKRCLDVVICLRYDMYYKAFHSNSYIRQGNSELHHICHKTPENHNSKKSF